MNIYIDVLFAINLVMNSLIFLTVSKILKIHKNFKYVLLGATASSLLYCILLVFFTSFFNFFSAIIILIIGLFITFGKIGYKKFLQAIIFSHMVAFFIGGAALAIYNYLNVNTFFGIIRNFPIGIFLFSTILSYLALVMFNIYLKKLKLFKKAFCNVQIFIGNESISIIALVDTGNSLVEPISNLPVIIAEKPTINKIVSLENIEDKIRVIPYKTVGNEGLLTGIRPDKVVIQKDTKFIETREVVIGLCDFSLCKKGGYQGLLSPAFLET